MAKAIELPGTKSLNDQLAEQLFEVRKSQPMSRRILGCRIGVAMPTINFYEREGRRLDLGEFLGICAGLQINPVIMVDAVVQSVDYSQHEESILSIGPPAQHGLLPSVTLPKLSVLSHICKRTTGDVLRNIRKSCKLSLRDAGKKMGVPHSFFGKIENTDRRCDVGAFVYLCQFYGVELRDKLQEIIDLTNEQLAQC